jgi:hypothetical protein
VRREGSRIEALVEAGVQIACIDARYNTSVVQTSVRGKVGVTIMGLDGSAASWWKTNTGARLPASPSAS